MTGWLTREDHLDADFDVAEVVAGIPDTYVVKGMFLSRLVDVLGLAASEHVARLKRPPRLGRFLPFHDYPQADFVYLACSAARHRHPTLALDEAMRRLARDDFAIFADSTLGKVILASVDDVRDAIRAIPKIFSRLAPGEWTLSVTDLDDATLRLQILRHPGRVAYQIGQLEGMLDAYGARGHVRGEKAGDRMRVDVRLESA